MNDELNCEQVTELAPELALDIAGGHERDAALRHLSSCTRCRRLVSELSSITDELVLLAPRREPPLGFGSRVLERLTEPPRLLRTGAARRGPSVVELRPPRGRRPRWATALIAAAAVVAAVALGAGSVFVVTRSDHRIADSYRAVLAAGKGSFFSTATLKNGQDDVGTAWGYEGNPSWVFAAVRAGVQGTPTFRVWLVTIDGRRLSLGTTALGSGYAGWGRDIPVALTQVRELLFRQVGGPLAFSATFHPQSPWGSG